MRPVRIAILLVAGLMAAPASGQVGVQTTLSGSATGFGVPASVTPAPFDLGSRTGVDPNGVPVVSNLVTITGITEPVQVTVSDLGTGGSPQIRVGEGAFGPGPLTVSDGQTLQVSVLPETGQLNRSYEAAVTVGALTRSFLVSTTEAPITMALLAGSVPEGELGQPYPGFDFTTLLQIASDPPGFTGGAAALTWSVSGPLPTGLTLNPETGVLAGTPAAVGGGEVTITVTHDLGEVASRSYTVLVQDPSGSMELEFGG